MSSEPLPRCVLHIPHASTDVPGRVRRALILDSEQLERELLRMTDWHTDVLFDVPPNVALAVVFPVSRLVVDPERFSDDAREPMAARGMGVVYTRTHDGKPLRSAPRAREREGLLEDYYRPHHRRLEEAVAAVLSRHHRCLILDCHSFPSAPLPYEDDQATERPDICIGTDAFHTPAWLRDGLTESFRRRGFDVALDRPFAGSLVPAAYHQRDARVSSAMIEVNRRLYLDETTGERRGDFEALREALRQIVREAAEAG